MVDRYVRSVLVCISFGLMKIITLLTSALDYETLRALDSDNISTTPSMSEEEINALPVHKYKVPGTERYT